MAKILHMTEAAFDALLTQKWLEGQAYGVELAQNKLQDAAADFFRRGEDQKARLYRDVLPAFLGVLRGELERAADLHEKDHVDGNPEPQETRELIKTVLAKAADEVMDEDSWPRDRVSVEGDMKVIADNVKALDVDPSDLLEDE